MSPPFLLLSPCQRINNVVFIFKESIQPGYASDTALCNNGQLHRSMHGFQRCKKIRREGRKKEREREREREGRGGGRYVDGIGKMRRTMGYR